MKKYFLFIAALIVFISCKQKSDKESPAISLYDSSYMPAVFSDPNRMEKIKMAFAVIDSLYKKHAEDNHFPAISFGPLAVLVALGSLFGGAVVPLSYELGAELSFPIQ